jgi:alpha-mannosidase
MQEYPEYRFGASQPQLYAFVKEHHPDLYARVKQAIADGRWEPQGCMWVEADCNICSGESLVRQCIHGKRFFREEFGVDVDHLWLPDVFGYSAALPQILQKSGVRYFLTQKISWNQFNKFPHHTFLWEGIDGTRVFTHFPPADTYNGNCRPRELLYSCRNFAEKDRTDRWLYPYGFGDGGGGPSRHQLESLRRARDCEELPRVEQGFARDFFREAEAAIRDLPLWCGELYLELHRGTLTTQALSKWYNRRCELGLRDGEMLVALAVGGRGRDESRPYGEAFDRLWKLVLLNQFHDIIPGSSIGWVYRDSRAQYEQVLGELSGIAAEADQVLAARVDTRGDGRSVLLFNTLSWDREDTVSVPLVEGEEAVTVEAAEGQALPTQMVETDAGRQALVRASVPSVGHAVVFVRPRAWGEVTNPLTVTERLLENEVLRAEFDEQGRLCRLLDKENRREVVPEGGVGNQLALYEDKPAAWDAWDVDIYYEEVPPETAELVSAEVGEKGPVRASIVQEKRVSNSTLRQEVRLAAGSRRLEFVTQVDWDETDRMLRTSFPVDVRADTASFEIQYGHVARPTHRNTSWDMARFEVVGHKWVDLSEPGYGVALLNDCKYGHKVLGNVLDLNLLRSPKTPDPDADIGHHTFTYALLPHAGMLHESDVIRQGYELNVPVRVIATDAHEGQLPARQSWVSVECEPGASVILEVLKEADDGNGLIARLYEAHGRPSRCVLRMATPIRAARVCNLLEEDEGDLEVSEGRVVLQMGRFEIVTVRVVV